MSIETIVSTYGYAAVFFGVLLEGETILVIAGFLCHRGYMHLPWVILAAYVATFAVDQMFFHLGRIKGNRALGKKPFLKQKLEKLLRLMNKHQTLLILGFRFMYGFRTITPILLGASGVNSIRYLLLNGIGAAVWAVVFGTVGYLIGHALELFLGELKRYEIRILLVIGVVGLIVWLVNLWKERVKVKSCKQSANTPH
jgi:membrane protein DedA with SNARE-associated domain